MRHINIIITFDQTTVSETHLTASKKTQTGGLNNK